MKNPFKKFFQILKTIVMLPVSFIQAKRTYQEIEKLRRLSPEEQRKLLAEMGMSDELIPLFDPVFQQELHDGKINKVDLSYLDDLEDDEGEIGNFDD